MGDAISKSVRSAECLPGRIVRPDARVRGVKVRVEAIHGGVVLVGVPTVGAAHVVLAGTVHG